MNSNETKTPYTDKGREIYLRENTDAVTAAMAKQVDADHRASQQARGIESTETYHGRYEPKTDDGPSYNDVQQSRRHAELLSAVQFDPTSGVSGDPEHLQALRDEFGHTEQSLMYLVPDGGVLPGRRMSDFPDFGVELREQEADDESPENIAFDLLRSDEAKRQAEANGTAWDDTLAKLQAESDARVKKAEQDQRILSERSKAIAALNDIVRVVANDLNVPAAELAEVYSAKRHLEDPDACDKACERLLARAVAISMNARDRADEARKQAIAAKEAELKALRGE